MNNRYGDIERVYALPDNPASIQPAFSTGRRDTSFQADRKPAAALGAPAPIVCGKIANPIGTLGTNEIRTAQVGRHNAPRLRALVHDLNRVTGQNDGDAMDVQHRFLTTGTEHRIPRAAPERRWDFHTHPCPTAQTGTVARFVGRREIVHTACCMGGID
jgi:hypothetical protein